jgi:hypothetical protein
MPERATPELLALQAKLVAQMSYRRVVETRCANFSRLDAIAKLGGLQMLRKCGKQRGQ